MTLPTQTFDQFVEQMTSSLAASTGVTPVFTAGDPFLASFESLTIQLQYLQGLVQQVLLLTRAQTSTGGDLDTWMAQFGFSRLPATYATGSLTLSSGQPAGAQVLVPAGTVVQTTPGGVQFVAVADTGQTAWSASLNAYVLQAGQTSINATFQAIAGGSASNVAAGAQWQIVSSLVGIQTVTNESAIQNGVGAESDSDYRARFVLYLATLAEGTKTAIESAISSVQQGLIVTPNEYFDPLGNAIIGGGTFFIDDGSGDPPATLIASCQTAADNVRAFGIRVYVAAAVVSNVTIELYIRVATGYAGGAVQAQVTTAINAYMETLVAGATVFVSSIEGVALAIAGVVAVRPGTLLNGENADFTPAATIEPRSPLTSITVGTY